MHIVLLIILLIYQMATVVSDIREFRMLLEKKNYGEARLDWYKEAIFWGWAPAGIIALFVAFSADSWRDMGLRGIEISEVMWLNTLALLFAGFITIVKGYQIVMYLCSETFRQRLAQTLEAQLHSDSLYEQVMLKVLTPVTRKEKQYWVLCSLTAGICEEIIFRGCMMFLLQSIFPGLHIAAVSVIAAVLFGLFHCYQGVRGVIATSVFGLMFEMLYLATDSLLPCMALHFLVDYSCAFLLDEKEYTAN